MPRAGSGIAVVAFHVRRRMGRDYLKGLKAHQLSESQTRVLGECSMHPHQTFWCHNRAKCPLEGSLILHRLNSPIRVSTVVETVKATLYALGT